MRVLFDFAKRQIAIDGDEPELLELLKLVRDVAPKLSHINILTGPPQSESASSAAAVAPQNGSLSDTQNPRRQPPLREWARSLDLHSIVERVTALGYYATKIEGKDSFSPKEMGDWFTICNFQKPSQMPVAIFDAKKKNGYVENIGHGKWRLTTGGENFVLGKLERVRPIS